MVQAARSGKQNIIEGSMASATSKETEVKLTNVARASLEELLADCRDFLRVNGYGEWASTHPYALRLRELNRLPDADYETFRKGIGLQNPEISANVVVRLIKVCSLLLSRQIRTIEREFLEEGGIRERMTRARIRHRNQR